MKQRVAITGIGLISPHGDRLDAVFDALMRGQSALRPWQREGAAATVAASVDFDPSPWFTRLQLSGVDRVSQMAVAAARLACQDAGTEPQGERSGVYAGTGMGGATAVEESFARHHEGKRVPPLSVPAFMANAAAAHIAMRHAIVGPVLTYSVACASSSVAIAEAAKAIAYGELDSAIAGGSEALLVPGAVRAWQALQTLAPPGDDPARACRPFSASRAGMVLGEGACFLVLENWQAARRRGARIYAELAGSGIACDATHLTRPDHDGQVRALRLALRNAGLRPRDIGYCNAHGTATDAGDVVEARALRTVWGDDIDELAVGSTKSMHGHLLGAAGALEAAVTALSLYRCAIPPSMHCDDPDPACALSLVREPGRRAPLLNAAISNSFAFGGTNVSLVMSGADASAW